ncbi:hypothetical protein [Pseudohaliea rubra]|uniref:hypothetical protein n=1 Tax=Pseudohaliea rubra TaxID=475795 RepID=UPI00118506AE|nr:hypothetical protein [Pseudohaliea rubra]
MARIFESGDQARDAAKKLEAAGYDGDKIFVMATARAPAPTPAQEDAGDTDAPAPAAAASTAISAEALVEKVSAAGELEITRAILCSRALAEGKALVVVGAPYGYLVLANQIMDGCGAAPAEVLNTAKPDNPSPFSDFIGMPCLERGLSFLSGDNPLKDSNWTLFPVKLKNGPTIGGNLIDKPDWLSSKIGMKTLSKEKPWRTSFGFKLLSNQQD